MTMSTQELETILADPTKEIAHDIAWADDEDHSPARMFRATVDSKVGAQLFVAGRFNPLAGTLSYGIGSPRRG